MNLDMIIVYATLHIVTIITFFLAFFTIAHMLFSRKKPSHMIAWTVVIIAIPYIGVLIYLIFNGRKITKSVSKKKKVELQKIYEIDNGLDIPIERFLRRSNITGATNTNEFYLCKNSVDAYEKIINALQNAQKCIYISTYIFGNDAITQKLLEILTQKAKEGVEVKLLFDAFGSLSLELFPKTLKALKKEGGEYKFFMSVLKHPIKNRLNFRNHRKMIIIDNFTAISGGTNLSKEYLSADTNNATWRDLSFIINGTATLHYAEIFKYDWESQTEEELTIIEPEKKEVFKTKSIIQVVPSGPDVNNDALYESILYALFLAQSRVWIVTPYFVPDGALMDALIIAKHRGVDIKLILPKTSDQTLADISRSGFLRDLQKEEIEILFYKTNMLHAKAMLIDDEIAMIGSSNFDARSFFYNFEVMSFLYSKEDIIEVEKWIETLFRDCDVGLKPAGKIRIVFENFFKMLSPAL
ncbi:MAG TPA: phospholipase [Campylobacterales bacterium]|nr:phospholipase [Campylobacterales bacterium]